jgi:hypothetical protein
LPQGKIAFCSIQFLNIGKNPAVPSFFALHPGAQMAKNPATLYALPGFQSMQGTVPLAYLRPPRAGAA